MKSAVCEGGYKVATSDFMGNHRLFYEDAKEVRDNLNFASDIAEEIHRLEEKLIRELYSIDQRRFYVRYGYNSLSGFCRFGLKFTKT